MIDIELQRITKDSVIPFDKYLLLYDEEVVMTGKLVAITKEGMQFSRVGMFNVLDMFIQGADMTFKPTHYAILNITINK
jgi:hypothetical protein